MELVNGIALEHVLDGDGMRSGLELEEIKLVEVDEFELDEIHEIEIEQEKKERNELFSYNQKMRIFDEYTTGLASNDPFWASKLAAMEEFKGRTSRQIYEQGRSMMAAKFSKKHGRTKQEVFLPYKS